MYCNSQGCSIALGFSFEKTNFMYLYVSAGHPLVTFKILYHVFASCDFTRTQNTDAEQTCERVHTFLSETNKIETNTTRRRHGGTWKVSGAGVNYPGCASGQLLCICVRKQIYHPNCCNELSLAGWRSVYF